MKSKLILFVITQFIALSLFAQTKPFKMGYTNVDYILGLMPESKGVETDIKTYKSQLDTQLQTKIKEFQEKNESFQKGASMMSDVIRADKERELKNLYESIEEFQKNAESSMQKKQLSLLQPLLEKIQKAIDAVSEEAGYSYIFNSDSGYGSTPLILRAPENDNVSDLILKKLGITPPPVTPKSKSTSPVPPAPKK